MMTVCVVLYNSKKHTILSWEYAGFRWLLADIVFLGLELMMQPTIFTMIQQPRSAQLSYSPITICVIAKVEKKSCYYSKK